MPYLYLNGNYFGLGGSYFFVPPSSYPLELEDGSTYGWWDYTMSNTITKDESNYVSAWEDRLGIGETLAQSNGSLQPLYTSDGIETDGISQYLFTGTTSLTQPISLYMVIKFPTYPGTWRFISQGGGNNIGAMIFYDKLTGGNIRLYTGNQYGGFCFVPFNKDFVFTAVFDGSMSYCKFNEGNIGGTSATASLVSVNGFHIGHRTSSYANLRVKEIILRHGRDSDETAALIQTYLFNKYIAPEIENDLLYDGFTALWYDYTDVSSFTLDASNITQWNNLTAVRADNEHFIQETSTLSPQLLSSGVYFDGISDTITLGTVNLGQPYTMYIVIKQHSWTHTDRIFSGGVNSGLIYQFGTSPNIRFYDPLSAFYIDTSALAVGDFGVMCVIGNGTNSLVQINDDTPVTKGENLYGQFVQPFYISEASYCANIEIKEIIIRQQTADDSEKRAAIYNYLKNKHSI